MKRCWPVLLVLVLGASLGVCLAPLRVAEAHGFQPGLLRIEPREANAYHLFRLQPRTGEAVPDWQLSPSSNCQMAVTEQANVAEGQAQWLDMVCTGGTHRLQVVGLSASRGEVVVQRGDGKAAQILRADTDTVALDKSSPAPQAWLAYVEAGIRHILAGWDHLAFVLLLALLVRDRQALVGAVTGFTVAHSLSLALVALDVVRVPQAPIEALIALSVAALAADVVLRVRGIATIAQRYPWLVASAFGLLHGTGFAAALRELGFARDSLLLPLLSFNVGVELGQLAFLAWVGLVAWAAQSYVGSTRVWVARGIGIASGATFVLRAIDSLGWGG